MKRLAMCDKQVYFIEDRDYENLLATSPNMARLAADADSASATHFVCKLCGQIAPVKLHALHECVKSND